MDHAALQKAIDKARASIVSIVRLNTENTVVRALSSYLEWVLSGPIETCALAKRAAAVMRTVRVQAGCPLPQLDKGVLQAALNDQSSGLELEGTAEFVRARKRLTEAKRVQPALEELRKAAKARLMDIEVPSTRWGPT